MSDVAMEEVEVQDPTYAVKVGNRLRAIRKQKRLSLQEVEASSNQEFKASVLRAYERGERALSVPRLQRLARFYSVPVDQLLPREEGDTTSGQFAAVIDISEGAGSAPDSKVTIDLVQLEKMEGPDSILLARYLSM